MEVRTVQKPSREVTINIGKGIYTLNTGLDVEAFDRVRELITEAVGEVSKGARQEDALVLGCLRLAYALDDVCSKLKGINDTMEVIHD